MALSNWDTLAYGPDGAPCDGSMHGFGSAGVEIYKNWIYIHSPKMWTDCSPFVKDTIAAMNHGDISIGDIQIYAARGPQNGVMVLVVSSKCPPKGPVEYRFMGGVGCSAYSDPTPIVMEALGVKKEDWGDIIHFSSYEDGEDWEILSCYPKDSGKDDILDDTTFKIKSRPEFEAQNIGVTQETRDFFINWLETEAAPDLYVDDVDDFVQWLQKIKEAPSQRFNQGDAFFVGPEEAATKVGEAEDTIMSKALKPKKIKPTPP